MTSLDISCVRKSFGSKPVLNDVSLQARSGEFIAVLGPSGCGKTTLLRLVAGFEEVEGGRISLGGRIVSEPGRHVAPEKRDIGVVFQNYALWPHMSVAENVGYSLKIAGVSTAERRRRVGETLDVVGLAELGERRPAELSGGQRQRVALARCLVARSSVVLLDEPLANLDVHLRGAMEAEFSDFHRRTGATMLYITHDQAEAMALADRVAVMSEGVLVQLAKPSELYREPATDMVAGFIGEGLVLPAEKIEARAGRAQASLFGMPVEVRAGPGETARRHAKICLRPRFLRLAEPGEAGIPGRVTRIVYRGGCLRLSVAPDAAPELGLTLDIPEPASATVGSAVAVCIDDGWLIPAKAA